MVDFAERRQDLAVASMVELALLLSMVDLAMPSTMVFAPVPS